MTAATANGRVARGRAPPAWCVQCAWYVWLALLAPFCGPARAYDIYPEPLAGRFAMNLDLGTAPVATSGYGVTTWKALAENALNAWNQTGIGPQQDHNFFFVRNPPVSGDACSQDGVSEVHFASTLCGLAFGSALAVTAKRISNGKRVESDVVFDSGRTWDAYSGPLQAGISEFFRVALHEFGHVAGLLHPDEDGQIKTALMNSQISNIDSLQADDIDGAHHVNWIWFAFPTQSGVALNATVTSNTITVTGLSAPAAISITGGEYSINGGPYTSAPGTVSGGQSVTLRVTASRAPMTAVTATLGIGAAAGDFTVITTAGGAPITVNTSSYSPLIDGSSKTYRKNGTEEIVSTVLPGTTLINGIATKAVQWSDGEISYDTNDGNGIRQHREFKSNAYLPGLGFTAITVTFSPPILNAPAIATMGLPITSSGTANYLIPAAGINADLSYATSVTLEAFETVTVPAGTFNTVRVNQSLNLSGFVGGDPVDLSSTGIVWVASGIGTVKSVVFSGDVTTRLLTSTSLATDAMLNFVAGWNLVGNGSSGSLDVATAFGDTTKVTTVWKWIANGAKWAFYAPSLVGQALTDYATSKGYDVLTTINGGEGFWVNARTPFAAQLPAGAAITSASYQTGLVTGWNLIAVGDSPTPSAFNKAIGATPPVAGDIPINLTTLWAWDAALTNWYFYAPSLDKSGGLTSYIQSKSYLDFGAKVLTPTTGFWVNKP